MKKTSKQMKTISPHDAIHVSCDFAPQNGRNRSLINAIDNLVFIFDSEDILVDCYEPTWLQIFDICKKSKGKKVTALHLPEKFIKMLKEAVLKTKVTGRVEYVNFDLDVHEKKMYLSSQISPIKNDDQKLDGTIVIVKNVTQEKQEEMELQSRLEELEKAKKALANLLQDMEEEKNKSLLLAKDLEKFKLAVDNSSDHIIFTNTDKKIIYANKAVQKITGYSIAEVLGKDPGVLWGRQMDPEFYKKLWETIHIEKKVFQGEITNKRRNDETYIADAQIAPILDEKKNIIFYVGIERDITKIKEIDKMKSEFVSVVSHQLRTPLTGIKWYVQFLLQNEKSPMTKEQKEFIEEIYTSNERMIKLVNDLLNVSRIETGRKFTIMLEKTDVIPLIKQTVDEQKILAQNKKIKLICQPELTEKITLIADPEKIQQVFQNLINNAIKYSFLNKKIIVGHKKEKNDFIFFVKDEGLGITNQQQARIFEKFFRADNILAMDTDGTGLGLYIAKAIVEGHGGKIWFKSKENEGTTFFVSLPLKTTQKKTKVIEVKTEATRSKPLNQF